MFRKAISFGGMLLLVAAATLATAAPGQAQHGGGGHGGGGAHFSGGGAHFSGGGAHYAGGGFGGAHYGGYHGGGYYGGYHGGIYHGGGNYGGYHSGYPYAHYGYRHYFPYYGLGGIYPYYGAYGYSYPYYDTYPYAGLSSTYDSGYASSYGDMVPYYAGDANSATPPASTYQAFYPPATTTSQSDTVAHVTVNVPADARIWIQGVPMSPTGTVREFVSPPLTAGTANSYEVRASWTENGREVTQTQQVTVTPGAHVRVDFPTPPETTAQIPSK